MHRRECLGRLGRIAVGLGAPKVLPSATARKVRIGAHPWVYAARQPGREPGDQDLSLLSVPPGSSSCAHRPRWFHAHLRDEKADRTWPEAMGEGVIDYAAVGRALHEIGFAGDLAIELAHERQFEPTRSYGESCRISREYVTRVIRFPE